MLTMVVKPPLLSSSLAKGLFDTGTTGGVVYENMFDFQTGTYTHTISATVGYDSMNIDIVHGEPETRDWIVNGLGRHVEVRAPSGVVWEGFINDISVSIGSVDLKIGPLLDIRNKVKVDYTTPRYNTNPPVGGEPASTAYSTNTESINRWGTFEEVISGGEGVAATMTAMRDSKLNELSWPKIGQDFSSGRGGTGTIKLSCLGYYHYLGRYTFDSNTTFTGLVNINEKISDILGADPDGLFSSSNASLETNTLQAVDYDEGRNALTAIQEFIGMGFSSGQRALFSVGANRHVTYKSLELAKDPYYTYSIYNKGSDLFTMNGAPVKPWDIIPGEWIFIQSVSARPFSDTLPRHSDPRYIFIESFTFTAPDSYSIQGGLGNTLKEKMATEFAITMRQG